jgi:hypothetical protein
MDCEGKVTIFIILNNRTRTFHSAWPTSEQASEVRDSLERLTSDNYTVLAYTMSERSSHVIYD